jgi:hypothetical protein
MQLIDELIGYTKANAEAARNPDDADTWMAHHRNCVRVKAEIERLRAVLDGIRALAGRRGPTDETEALNKIEAVAKAALAE